MEDTNYNNKEFKDIIYTGEHIFEKEFRKCTFYHCISQKVPLKIALSTRVISTIVIYH